MDSSEGDVMKLDKMLQWLTYTVACSCPFGIGIEAACDQEVLKKLTESKFMYYGGNEKSRLDKKSYDFACEVSDMRSWSV